MDITNLKYALEQSMQDIHDTLPNPTVESVRKYCFLLDAYTTLSSEPPELTYVFNDQLIDVFTSSMEAASVNAESLYLASRYLNQ